MQIDIAGPCKLGGSTLWVAGAPEGAVAPAAHVACLVSPCCVCRRLHVRYLLLAVGHPTPAGGFGIPGAGNGVKL